MDDDKGGPPAAHLKNKQAIVDAMAARMIAEATVDIGPRTRWDVWLVDTARAFRRVMRAHKDGARVVASADLSKSDVGAMHERALALFLDAGFPARDGAIALLTAIDFTLGATYEGQTDPLRTAPRADEKPLAGPLAQALRGLDEDGVFEAGLQLVVSGLRARLSGRGHRAE